MGQIKLEQSFPLSVPVVESNCWHNPTDISVFFWNRNALSITLVVPVCLMLMMNKEHFLLRSHWEKKDCPHISQSLQQGHLSWRPHVIYIMNYLNAKTEIAFHVVQEQFVTFIVCQLCMRQSICTTNPLPSFGEFLNDSFIQYIIREASCAWHEGYNSEQQQQRYVSTLREFLF